MQLIPFDPLITPVVIKTFEKYIQMMRNGAGEIKFKDMTCRHRGGPLTHGTEEDDSISCPWHGKKMKLCKIRYLDIPFVENGHAVWVGIESFERIIQNS